MGHNLCTMAKYVKEVEALQFTPKEDEKQLKEVVINGGSQILHAGDYAIYEEGQIVSIVKEAAFKAQYKEVWETAPEEAKPKKKSDK